jgi:hypothetical protein
MDFTFIAIVVFLVVVFGLWQFYDAIAPLILSRFIG